MKEFPLEWKECQYCGETETVGGMIVGMVDPANMKPAFLSIRSYPIIGAMAPDLPDQQPHVVLRFDFCAGCGRERMVGVGIELHPIVAKS